MAEQVMTSALRNPLPIEFAHAGGWLPGVLLGWRSDGPEACRLRIQCVVGGLRHTIWMSLADLRLAPPTTPSPLDDVLAWPHRPAAVPHQRDGHRTGEHPRTFV